MDWTIPVIILQLIFLQVILSIDNAAVLGSLVAHLPDDRPVQWPKAMWKIGDWLHPFLGNQRTAALRVGLIGAYLAQGAMLFLATQISNTPWIKLIGALYLVRLAFDNLGEAEVGEADYHIHPIEKISFWSIVLTVEISDIVFSIDNIVAAVAVTNRFWLVVIGVFIGILLMRIAAGWFSYLVDREPILKKAAYILIMVIGVEIIYSEYSHVQLNSWLRLGISVAIILLSLLYAHSKLFQKMRPIFIYFGQGFANVNELVDWALLPPLKLLKLIWSGICLLFGIGKKPKDTSSKSSVNIEE
jgi:tellurite resistance protein TerC